jgi:glucosamine-6-phosphate deaminase
MTIDPRDLEAWCRIPVEDLPNHPTKIPFEIVEDPAAMGRKMALELVETIEANPSARVIVPCGPSSWYAPWREEVNARELSLAHVTVFHMDECLDAQARPVPPEHPYNFRAFMEREFYGGIPEDRNVPERERYWLEPSTAERVAAAIVEAPIDLTLGGWGQDGHVAYNQARRHPFSRVGLEELADSTIRIQENNIDTVIALAHRTFGAAYQFVPPMSITLGMRECLSAAKVRLYSDTGAWKQTAFRVALFSDPDPEYPITLLQRHPDARITATVETARHPLAEHPEWQIR